MSAPAATEPVQRREIALGTGAGPTIADVVAVARGHATVALAPGVMERAAAARRAIEAAAADGAPVYGLTTGLGAAIDTALDPDDVAAFQRRAIPARAVGVGATLTREEVRATLFVRLAGLAQGASGITPGFLPAIRDMLNRGIHPVVRRLGSLGEADLAPLAGLFLPFAGAGTAELDGAILSGPEALARAGIAPPRLGAKDGIALINASSFSVGLGALALDDVRLALDAAAVAGALTLEAFRANLSVIDPRVVALRPAPGQAEMSGRLCALLAGSDLFEPGRARRVQDPLSIRCLAPVLGVAYLRLGEASAAVEADLAGAGDSPAYLGDTGDLASTVNFDTTAIALAFEALGQALAHAGTIAAFRVAKLMSPALSGLPRFLAARGGSRTGFATALKSAAALDSCIRHLALPVGPMAMPVADGVEDYAPMTPQVVDKTHAIARHVARLAAIELATAAAAIDLRDGIRLGAATGRVHTFVRTRVRRFDEDRATGEDFETLAEAIGDGSLAGVVAGAA